MLATTVSVPSWTPGVPIKKYLGVLWWFPVRLNFFRGMFHVSRAFCHGPWTRQLVTLFPDRCLFFCAIAAGFHADTFSPTTRTISDVSFALDLRGSGFSAQDQLSLVPEAEGSCGSVVVPGLCSPHALTAFLSPSEIEGYVFVLLCFVGCRCLLWQCVPGQCTVHASASHREDSRPISGVYPPHQCFRQFLVPLPEASLRIGGVLYGPAAAPPRRGGDIHYTEFHGPSVEEELCVENLSFSSFVAFSFFQIVLWVFPPLQLHLCTCGMLDLFLQLCGFLCRGYALEKLLVEARTLAGKVAVGLTAA